MSRKVRRRIKRRKKENKPRKQKNLIARHFNGVISNKWTRLTTYIIIGLEIIWVVQDSVWFIVDMILRAKGM
jgi:hypothetical protein